MTNWALAGRLAHTRTHAGHRRYPKHEVRAFLALGHLRLVELPEVQALLHMRSYPRGSRVRRRDHADERVLTVVSQQRRPPGPVQLLLQAGNEPVEPVAAYLVALAQVRQPA